MELNKTTASRTVFLLFFIAMLASSFSATAIGFSGQDSVQSQSDSIRFRWNMVTGRPMKQGFRVSSFSSDTTLTTDSRLKFYFIPETDCYVYLFAQWSQGNIELLLPSKIERMGKMFDEGKSYTYPEKWVQLDSVPGSEKLYLLVSSTRLSEIENAYRAMVTGSRSEKEENAKRLLLAINNKKKEAFQKRAVISVIPAEIGGAVRGVRQSLPISHKEIELKQVKGTGLYVKQLVIMHTH